MKPHYSRKFVLLASTALALIGTQTNAAEFIWVGGGGSANANTATNWSGGASPGSTNTADIFYSGTPNTFSMSFNPNADWTWKSITFSTDANFTINRSANAGILGTVAGGITAAASGSTLRTYSILDEYRVAANQTWTTSNPYSKLVVTQAIGNLALGANTLTLDTFDHADSTITIGSAISGTGSIIKSGGAGTAILSGANTYSGTTSVGAGLLSLTNALSLQNSALDTTNSIAGTSIAGLMTNQTTLQLGGLVGDKNLADVFTISSGGYSNVTALTLNPGSGITRTYSAIIANGATDMTLTKTGAGTQVLSGANTYTGSTTVTAGTLTTTTAAALANHNVASKVVFNGGTIGVQVGGSGWTTEEVDTLLANATKTSGALGINTDNGSLIQWTAFTTTNFGSALGMTKLGANALTLGHANTYHGATTLSAGTLNIDNNAALGTGTLVITGSGTIGNTSGGLVTIPNAVTMNGTLFFNSTNNLVIDGDVALTGNRSINVTTDAGNALTLNGVISDGGGAYSLSKNGGGNLTLTNPNNSFTGILSIDNGRSLTLSSIGMSGVNSAAGAGSQISLGYNTTLAYTGSGDTTDRTLNVTNGNTSNFSNNGSGALIFTGQFVNTQAAVKEIVLGGSNTGANEISSVLTDSTNVSLAALSVSKVNGGNWILSGANTYSGGTSVANGTLLVNNSTGSGTGTGNVQVNLGTLGGTGTISGAVTIGNGAGSADSILAPGNGIGPLATGNLAFASDGRYSVEVNGTTVTSDRTNVTGTVTLASTTSLAVAVTGTLAAGQQFTIIDNDGAEPVSGIFAGLAQGAVVGSYGSINLTISYAGGDGNDVVLTAVGGGTSPYDTWASGSFANPFLDTDPAVDFDKDGLSNLLEFVLGGDPTISQSGIAPSVVSAMGGNLVITFKRADASELAPAVTTKVQLSDDLTFSTPANDIVIGPDSSGPIAPSGASYTVVNSGGIDTITVTIPGGGTKRFARVSATQP